MSFTQTHHVFAGVQESGINTLLHAVFTARPHYLNYGSAPFVPASTVSATNVSTIPFPGIPGGIPYAVRFGIPTVDLFPPNGASPLPPGPNQFNIHTQVRLTVGCMHWTSNPAGTNEQRPTLEPISVELDVWALGEINSHYFGPGTGFISFQVDEIRLPGVLPENLEQVLDCVIRMILQAALSNVALPFNVLSAGAFQLILQQGPTIDANQIEVWGDV
jgi:hypothetical protein